jgi:nucleotide-binding universal stress UspA family protein
MPALLNDPTGPATAVGHPFRSVVCAMRPAADGVEAVRQAAVLAGRGGSLDVLSFAPSHRPGAPHPVGDQIEALVRASAAATSLGVHARLEIVECDDEARAAVERCAGRDLLVVPPGEVAFAALARAASPVLVARRPPAGVSFPESILAGVDGSPGAHDAARVAAALAAAHGAHVALVAAPEHDADHQHALQEDQEAVLAATGTRPLVLDEHGSSPERAIVAAAGAVGAGLVVVGSRPGTPSGSVSAAVARLAPCSVLVLRRGGSRS